MKKYLFLSIFLSAFSTALSGQINPADSTVQALTYWDIGEAYDYTITHQRYRVVDWETTSHDRLSYDVTISVVDSTPADYTVKWRYKAVMGQRISSDAEFALLYKISANGDFIELVNLEELASCIDKEISLIARENEEAASEEPAKEFFDMLTDKNRLESLLIKDIRQYHAFHGGVYRLGEEYEGVAAMPLIGGAAIDMKFKVFLSEIYENGSSYMMTYLSEADSGRLMPAVSELLADMTALFGDIPLPEDIPQEEFRREANVYSIIHDWGWVIYSESTTTISAGNTTVVEKRHIDMK